MTQNMAVLRRLMERKSLTHLDALNDPTIRSTRLAARINDLRRDGWNIITDTVRDGDKRYASYRMAS